MNNAMWKKLKKETDHEYFTHGNMYIVSVTNVYLLFGYHSPAPCELYLTNFKSPLSEGCSEAGLLVQTIARNFLCNGLVFRYYLHVVKLDFDFIKYRTHFYPCMLCAKFNSLGQIFLER